MSADSLLAAMMAAPQIGHAQMGTVPLSSGVYTAWLGGEARCVYVGKAGKTASGNLRKRIQSHFSGQRGSDQFCLYAYDAFIHYRRCQDNRHLTTKQVNQKTSRWIRAHVTFRWLELSPTDADAAEFDMRRELNPILNPL
jgi:hypothetical protein